METCKQVHRFVCEQLDQDINSPRCRAIKKHLETCQDCSEYLATLKKTVTLYRLLPPPHMPQKAHKQLFKRLTRELGAPHAVRKQSPRRG
jgi:anti-sigma factor RsiW